jgi:uridylate kinase
MKKTIVISLGGSLIIPEKIDFPFLEEFKKTLLKLTKKYNFVVVCGGGVIARKYIEVIRKSGQSEYFQSQAGIRATRENAKLMMQFFTPKYCNTALPMDMKSVRDSLKKNPIVFTGALRFVPHSTSDETAAKLANYLKTEFINMTNVPGLYDKNPKKHKNARFIPEISFSDFKNQFRFKRAFNMQM